MSLPVKIGLFIALLVALAAGFGVYLQRQLTPEKVRETLIPLVESVVSRDVEFGNVQIGLLSGITVDHLVIKKLRRNQEDFIAVKKVRLLYQFLPLLTGRFVVNEVLLEDPVIAISRAADGSLDFSDLLPAGAGDSPSDQGRKGGVAFPQDLFSLLVKEITISNGTITYTDAYQNPNAPYRYQFDHLNLHVRDLTLDSLFPVDASLRFDDAQLDISGHYDISRRSGDLVLHLSSLDLVPFAPYYRNQIPGKLGAGNIAMKLEVDLNPDQYSSKGKFTLDGVDLTLDALPDARFKGSSLSADYAAVYQPGAKRLDISTLLVGLDGVDVAVDGGLDFAGRTTMVNLNLLLQDVDLRQVMTGFPKDLLRDYRKYSFAGKVNGRIAVAGPVDRPAELFQSARLSLDDVRMSTENLRLGLSGEISYRDRVLKTSGLALSYGNQKALLTLDVKRQGRELYQGTFSLAADNLDCNELLGRADSVGTDTSSDSQAGPENEPGPFDLPLDLTGTIAANNVIYRELSLEKVTADVRLRGNRLRLQNIRAAVGNGRIRGESSLDLGVRGLAYSGEAELKDMELAGLYKGLYPDGRQNISGSLALDTTFSGHGTRKADLLKALSMEGSFAVADGSLRGFPTADAVAVFLGAEELRGFTFQSLNGRYRLLDQVISQGSSLTGSKVRLSSQGTVDLGGQLNLKVDSRIAPQVLRRSGTVSDVMASLTDEQGWGRIPLVVKGPFDRPQVQPDGSAIEGMMLSRAKEKAVDKLTERLNSKGAAQEGVKELLDNTLNRLFGR